jgi:hypothetical protein
LTRGREAVKYEIEKCLEFRYPIGIKMVRGAYLVEETHLSQLHKYQSPICETIEKTHETMN